MQAPTAGVIPTVGAVELIAAAYRFPPAATCA
jgi:hypothetical protein